MHGNYYAVIMAGGGGTRLWPLSRQSSPKQSLSLLGDRTMFQVAVDRLQPLFPPERICVVTAAQYAEDLRAQRPRVPAENYILEPAPRGTAPAIALAALRLRERDRGAVMACLTADHAIREEARFRDLLAAAGEVAQAGHLVTLGIEPTFAATGFGYIQQGEGLGYFGGFEAFRAVRFKEKPDEPEAQAMATDGQHSWNSGMFVWTAARILGEIERQMPDFHRLLGEIAARPAALDDLWQQAPKTTVDYGIMEGGRDVAVIPATGLGWSDIGSWEALLDLLPADGDGNVVVGADYVGDGTRGTLVHTSPGGRKRLVATLGVEGLVIVDTEDVLLVCSRERSQDVRKLVEMLKQRPDGDLYL